MISLPLKIPQMTAYTCTITNACRRKGWLYIKWVPKMEKMNLCFRTATLGGAEPAVQRSPCFHSHTTYH